jgi:hypothetical protein
MMDNLDLLYSMASNAKTRSCGDALRISIDCPDENGVGIEVILGGIGLALETIFAFQSYLTWLNVIY